MKRDKILITGGAGFIGSHLHDYYEKKGHEVKSIDNFIHSSKHPQVQERVAYGDIRYNNDIEELVQWSDVVFHLAAQIHVDKSITNPQETLDINVGGTLCVLEAVRKYDKRMVFASSSEIYGSQDGIEDIKDYEQVIDELMDMSEDHPLDCQSPYAASKVAGDRLCYSYWKTYGTKVAILRNFNTFGKYQNDGSYGGVIAIFTKAALEGKPLNIFGDGTQERDYMSVNDAVKGYEFCINNELWGKPVNIGTGVTVSVNDIANKIKAITGSSSEVNHIEPRAGEVQRLCADISTAREKGFKITTDFDKELTNYVKWYERCQLPKVSDKSN